jgi:hypothetical protein
LRPGETEVIENVRGADEREDHGRSDRHFILGDKEHHSVRMFPGFAPCPSDEGSMKVKAL